MVAEAGQRPRADVCVVIPTRDRPHLLRRALASVAEQSWLPRQVVVVADGERLPPLDRAVPEGVELTLVETPVRVGGGRARNLGAAAARWPWVAFLDDDDEWLPTKLERQMTVASRTPDTTVVACRVIARTPSGDAVWPRRAPAEDEPVGDYLLVRHDARMGETLLQTSMLLARSEVLTRIPFTEGLPRHQEWDWLIRLEAAGLLRLAFVESAEVVWHTGDGGPRITTHGDWAASLDWITSVSHLVSREAAQSFILTFIPRIARQSKGAAAIPVLWRAASAFGRPRPRHVLLCAVAFGQPGPQSAAGRLLRRLIRRGRG